MLEIFRSSLHGSLLEVTQYWSEIRWGMSFLNFLPNLFCRENYLQRPECVERHGHSLGAPRINLPESDDCWKHMIDDQIVYNKEIFFRRSKDASHFWWCYVLQNWWCIYMHANTYEWHMHTWKLWMFSCSMPIYSSGRSQGTWKFFSAQGWWTSWPSLLGPSQFNSNHFSTFQKIVVMN